MDYTLSEISVGMRVQAFHPRTLGVVYHGTVTKVGRKYATIDFGQLLGGEFRVAPQHVTRIVALPGNADDES